MCCLVLFTVYRVRATLMLWDTFEECGMGKREQNSNKNGFCIEIFWVVKIMNCFSLHLFCPCFSSHLSSHSYFQWGKKKKKRTTSVEYVFYMKLLLLYIEPFAYIALILFNHGVNRIRIAFDSYFVFAWCSIAVGTTVVRLI